MKALVALLLLFVFPQNISIAQRTFINPGIKLGYQFGKDGGFSFGFETSFTYMGEKGFFYGAVFAIDRFQRKNYIHIGLEVATPFVGLEVGPTFLNGTEPDIGFGATIYTGLGLYPYFRYTNMKINPDVYELGTFLKLPVKISGEDFKM